MPQKLIAVIAGVSLVTLAAVGVFASQDAVTTQEDPTPEATATLEPDATATELPEATETASPEPTATEFVDATSTPDDADEDEDHEDQGDDEDGQREIGGIPQSNPNFVDEDGDGVCEKGEAVVKTTPSGRQVRVPCHAAKDAEEKHQDKQKDSDANDDDQGEDESEDSD